MDWDVIAQAIFFLAIGFIAIIITVFVFATSLLGLAIQRASSEQKKLQEEQKASISQKLDQIQEQLNKAKQKCDTQEVKRLSKESDELREQIKEHEKSLASIPKRYTLPFTVRIGVAWPGICFLLSSIFSGLAWSLFHYQLQTEISYQNTSLLFLGYLLMVLSIVAIIFGGYRLYLNLKAIQEVSVSAEEAVLGRMKEAVKTAYSEYEAEKKPEMQLEFKEPKPPIQIVQGGEAAINFEVSLIKGEIGREARVALLAPLKFDFINKEKIWDRLVPNPTQIGIEYRIGLMMPGSFYPASLTIKAPPQRGTYTFCYVLQCEGFTSAYEKFDVEVIP